jgi:hypothetical protein
MPTTTNYGWTTPADTDLVKDGAAAIRTLGSSIDTTVFTNASAGIPKTIVDAKGDLIAATASDTVSRLAVGANDTVLMADSTAATGLKWGSVSGGGMTVLASGTLSGTSVTLSSIAQTYNTLILKVISAQAVTTAGVLLVRTNNVSTADHQNGFLSINTTSNQTASSLTGFRSNDCTVLTVSNPNYIEYTFPNYTSTTSFKPATVFADRLNTTTWGVSESSSQTAAITSLVILNNNATSFNGGTYVLYGVK